VRIFPANGLVWAVCVLAATSAIIIPVRGFVFLWVLAALALLCLVVFDLLRVWRSAGLVHAGVSIPNSRIRGGQIPTTITVRNDSANALGVRVLPVLPGQGTPRVFDATLDLKPNSFREIVLPIEATLRGTHSFGDVCLRMTSPLRMVQAQRLVAHDATCKVYPDIETVKEYIVARRMRVSAAPHLRTARLRGIGSEFESLRDYEQGDDIRHIDWKASARHQRLITRNYEVEHHRNIILVVDRGRLMAGQVGTGTKLDCAIDTALMVAGVALDGGDRCGLLLFDEEVASYIPPNGGMPQLNRIVDALYDTQPKLVESHFRRAFVHLQTNLTKRSFVVVLSDANDPESSGSLMHGMAALTRRHLVLLAALRTPEVEDVIARDLREPEEPYRKAVAYRLVKERGEVMARLQKAGVHVLDVAPDDLTVPLVNKYLELREANLL
jgi:uncharacterized protein (DUF58 family)